MAFLRRLVGRARDAFPITRLGLGVALVAVVAFNFGAVRETDRILLVVSVGSISLVLVALICVLVGVVTVALLGTRETASRLDLETGIREDSGLDVSSLPWLPLVDVRTTWSEPTFAKGATMRRRFGRLGEHVVADDRGTSATIRRRVEISDAFGLASMTLSITTPRPVRAMPRMGALRSLPPLVAHIAGDALPHPTGTPDGDRIDLRRYAPGDPVRHIAWKVLARTGKLMVRAHERARTIAPHTAAYLVAGERDDASAGAARLAVTTGALGETWTFSADGANGATSHAGEAVEMIVQSSNARASGATRLARFLDDADKHGRVAVVLFCPAKPGSWIPRVTEALVRRPDARAVIAVDGLARRDRPTRWRRWFVRTPDANVDRSSDVRNVVDQLRRARVTVHLVDRTTGRTLSEGHLARDGEPRAASSVGKRAA